MSKEFFGRSYIEDLGFRTSKCGPEITLKIWIEVFPTSKCGSSHLLVQNTSTQIFNVTSYEKLFIHYNINHKNLN